MLTLSERIDRWIAELGEIGATDDGGVTRLGLTAAESAAMELVGSWMRELGVATEYDAARNLAGTWNPDGSDSAAVVTGSHVDSVPHGGRYDGAAGVVVAVAALSELVDRGARSGRPLRIQVFAGEEGSRFPIGLLGSHAAVHGLDAGDLEARDEAGVTVREALREAGGDPDALAGPLLAPGQLRAFIEVHIEQGRVLEEAGRAVGVVTDIAAPVFVNGSVVGTADHAGATPMRLRRDALLGGAEFALAVERICLELGDTTVATVGKLTPQPGAMNVIPGRCDFTLDLRDVDRVARDRVEAALQAELEAIAGRRDLVQRWQVMQRLDPVPLADTCVRAIEHSARQRGVLAPRIVSGAAHDAMHLSEIAPTGMIFVRCREGVSHAPSEYASGDDLAVAAMLLADTLSRLADS